MSLLIVFSLGVVTGHFTLRRMRQGLDIGPALERHRRRRR